MMSSPRPFGGHDHGDPDQATREAAFTRLTSTPGRRSRRRCSRAQRFGDLDLEHVIEEIEDLGTSLHWSARSRVRTIIEHLLKLQVLAGKRPAARLVRHHPGAARRPSRRAHRDLAARSGGGAADPFRAGAQAGRDVHCASMARMRPPTPCPRPAPTPSTRSPATGCRKQGPRVIRHGHPRPYSLKAGHLMLNPPIQRRRSRRRRLSPPDARRTSRARRRSRPRSRRRRHRSGRP